MKRKKTLSASLAAMLIVSMVALGVSVGVNAVSLPVMYVYPEPPEVIFSSSVPDDYLNDQFTVEVRANDTVDYYGADFHLYWNDTLLDLVSATINETTDAVVYHLESDMVDFSYSVATSPSVINTEHIEFSATFIYAEGATVFNGDGTIAWLTFEIVYAPPQIINDPVIDNEVNCTLEFDDAWTKMFELTDTIPGYMTMDSPVDGWYEYTTEGVLPGMPVADFTVSPPFPFVSDYVTLDGGISDPGANAYIELWQWTITGDADFIVANNASVASFHCNGTGDVTVKLNITNNFGKWHTTTKVITQMEVAGPIIDLYDGSDRQYPEGTWTPYNGTGIGVDSDSYAPGENVTLYAEVTYNGDVVQNIIVGFEVKTPMGEPWVVRSDRTDENGIATINFRLPIPGPTYPDLNEEELFGHWWVIAKCKLQDEIINDTKSFKVGWIVEITGLETIPYDLWYKTEYVVINVTLKNIAWIPRNVVVVVVIYDDCDVPIGQVVIPLEIPAAPAEICSSYAMSIYPEIHIPKWAYVGPAKVYGNVFTYLPQDSGIPYAPEVAYDIYIDLGARP